ncbi:MAG: hypothetical protein Q4D05_04150 [Acinetobacter sp.]|nr:hypothetical protein [Acinetobacter sp.]
MPISIVEYYYQMIEHLDRQSKIELVAKITQSIEQKPNLDMSKFTPIQDLTGAWIDDDLHEIGMTDYIAVSDDNTDKNWFSDLSAFIDENIKISDLPYSANHRGWTRDELYE